MSSRAPRFETLHACPICGSGDSRERFSSPDLLMGVPGVFHYVECDACRTVYQNPRVREEDLALCYPAGYFTHGGSPWAPTPAPAGSLRDRIRRAICAAADRVPDDSLSPGLRAVGRLLALQPGLRRRARLGLVDGLELPPAGRGRCLEVGPGQGIALFSLRTLGWDAVGLEVDPVAAEQARATSGCEVRVGTLASTDYPAGSFDLLYMSHVFEHLAAPRSALERCFDLLRPGGRLVLIYPNPAALTARRYGAISVVWDPPRHLVLPPPTALLALGQVIGFVDAASATMARLATVSADAARRRLRGGCWDPTRLEPPGLSARAFGVAEGLLVAAGRPVGEEIVVRARKPDAAP